MPATIYQGGFATDTIQAGNVMVITSSGSALVERFDGQNVIDKAAISGSKSLGPFIRAEQVRITALSGNVTYSQDRAGENQIAQVATDADGSLVLKNPYGGDIKQSPPTLHFESGAGFCRRADGVSDTTKIVLCRVPIPKEKISDGCTIRTTHYWTFSPSGQTKNLCLGVDDTSVGASYFVGSTSTGNAYHGIHEIIFRGDKTAPIAPNQGYAGGQSANAPVVLTGKDFNEDRELVFYAYWNALSTNEWIELSYVKVEIQ